MLTVFSSQNAATSALTAITVILGAMSLGGTAQATESNPLLGGTAGTMALNSEQMEGVEGSGRLGNHYGRIGVNESWRAYNTGRYALYTLRWDNSAKWNAYDRAAGYASSAATNYRWAAYYTRQGR